jgi:hypothetical protein
MGAVKVRLGLVVTLLIVVLVCGILIGYLASGQIGQLLGKGGQVIGQEVTLKGSVSLPLCDSPTHIDFSQNNGQTFTYTYTIQGRPFNYSIQLPDNAAYNVLVHYIDTCGGGSELCYSYVQVKGDTRHDISC